MLFVPCLARLLRWNAYATFRTITCRAETNIWRNHTIVSILSRVKQWLTGPFKFDGWKTAEQRLGCQLMSKDTSLIVQRSLYCSQEHQLTLFSARTRFHCTGSDQCAVDMSLVWLHFYLKLHFFKKHISTPFNITLHSRNFLRVYSRCSVPLQLKFQRDAFEEMLRLSLIFYCANHL